MHIGITAALGLCIGCAAVSRSSDQPSANTLRVTQRVEHLDRAAREAMIVQHPNGTLFVTGYFNDSVPTLYRSVDNGKTWNRVDVGADAYGAGNSDVDLAMARDGTLYFISMVYDRQNNIGKRISIGSSSDAGVTWHWKTISRTDGDDRPWIDVAPDGAAHAIWNDGQGVSYVASRNRGQTWSDPVRINHKGGSSHLAVGPRGEIAARITPFSKSGFVFDREVDLIAVSEDNGATWRKSMPPSHIKWVPYEELDKDPNSIDRWVEPLAWDEAGNLYHLWTDTIGVNLARSADRGLTWRTWKIVQSGPRAHFPYVIAKGNSDLAATWYTGTDSDLRAHVARITIRNDSPSVVVSEPILVEAWSRRQEPGDTVRHRDTAGEYFPVAFLKNGGLGAVTTIQNVAGKRMGFTWWEFN
jgi:hypothetical protein